MTKRISAVLVAVLIGGLIGCSSDGEPEASAAEQSFDVWRSETLAVCEEYEVELDAAAEAMADPIDLADFTTKVRRAQIVLQEWSGAVLAIEVPTERTERVEQLYAGLQATMDLWDEALQALESGDLDLKQAFPAVSCRLR